MNAAEVIYSVTEGRQNRQTCVKHAVPNKHVGYARNASVKIPRIAAYGVGNVEM
jgi:hypothetical protein